jgi:hypothetical protein
MVEEEIKTPMDEVEIELTLYEEFVNKIPFYYRGWAITLVAFLSFNLPLLWLVVIYQLIMRERTIVAIFEAFEEFREQELEEAYDNVTDAMEKIKEAKRNVAEESNQLRAAAECEIWLNRQIAEAQRAAEEEALDCNRKFGEQIDEMYKEAHEKVELEIEALLKEKAALNLAVKQLRETHEQLQMVYAEEDEIRTL